jgi:hypothetical protein
MGNGILSLTPCCVGAYLYWSTFVLRKTDTVAFVPCETIGTLNVSPKKLICVTIVLRSNFLMDKEAHLSRFILRDKKTHLSHVIFINYLSHIFLTAIEVRRFTAFQM